jgi:CRP-like cAMP-binding protein
MSNRLTVPQLRALSPLDGLKDENLSALVKKTEVMTASAGTVLFNEGDVKKVTIYLLSGTVVFEMDGEKITTIEGGTPQSRNPLAPRLPRQYSAKAATAIEYIILDTDLLDVMLTWDQTGSYEVIDLDEDGGSSDDWMTTLLQTKAFHKIPPANIQAIFMRLQQVNARAGDVIIKQGQEGDYFYIITRGSCVVTRETPLSEHGIRLAALEVGDTFGEEALIAESKRNATVRMRTDGSLMRLAKDDFQKLLNEPMLDWVDREQADAIIADGGKWLDVRLPSEFEAHHNDGAINVPLYFIRLKLKSLDKSIPYVVCCDTGRRSSAAAFILNERGFRTYVLTGGLNQNALSLAVEA